MQSLPEFIYELENLEYIYLPDDKYEYFSKSMLKLNNLKYVFFPYSERGEFDKDDILD